MSQRQRIASSILRGLTIGIAAAIITHVQDERKFEPTLTDKAKALDAKLSADGAELAGKLTKAKSDAKIRVKETTMQ